MKFCALRKPPALRLKLIILLLRPSATPFVIAYQDVLFHGRAPEPMVWTAMAVAALVAWSVGAWVFGRLSDTLIEAV